MFRSVFRSCRLAFLPSLLASTRNKFKIEVVGPYKLAKSPRSFGSKFGLSPRMRHGAFLGR